MRFGASALRRAAICLCALVVSTIVVLSFAVAALADSPGPPADGIALTPKSLSGGIGGCSGSGSAVAPGTGSYQCWGVSLYMSPGSHTVVPVITTSGSGQVADSASTLSIMTWTITFDSGAKSASGSAPIAIPAGATVIKSIQISARFGSTQQQEDGIYDFPIPPAAGSQAGSAATSQGSGKGGGGLGGLAAGGLTLAALAAAAAGLMAAGTGAAVTGASKPGQKIIVAPKAGDQMGPDLTFDDEGEEAASASTAAAASGATHSAAASNGEGDTVDVSELGEGPPDVPIDPNDLLDQLIHSKSVGPETVDVADLGEKPPDFVQANTVLDDSLPIPDRKVKVASLGDRADPTTQGPAGEDAREDEGDKSEAEDDNTGGGGLGGALTGHGSADPAPEGDPSTQSDKKAEAPAQPPAEPSKPVLARDQSGLSEPPDQSAPDKLDDGLEPPKLDKIAEGVLKEFEPPAGFDRNWNASWDGHHAYNPDTGEVAHYSGGHWTVSELPDGFSPSDNPNFASNPVTGAVAHYDPTTNQWSVPQPPPGFEPLPGAQGGDMPYGSMDFVNPTTGQTIHYGGQGWVDNGSGGPVTHSYNSSTGQSAYLDPNTQQWAVHDAPPGYQVDRSVRDDQLGYHYVNESGDRATFDPYHQQWVDEKTGQPVVATPVHAPEPASGQNAGGVPPAPTQSGQVSAVAGSGTGDAGSEPQTVERPNTYVRVDPKMTDQEAAQAGRSDEAYPEGDVTRNLERRGIADQKLRDASLPAEHSDYQPPVSVVNADKEIPVDKPQPGADEQTPQTVERPNSSVKARIDEKDAADANARHEGEPTIDNAATLQQRREITQQQNVDQDSMYVPPVTTTTASVNDHSDHIPVPEGPPNRDHQKVLDEIADTQARLDKARAEGASQAEIDQLQAHLQEFQGYEAAYHTLGGAHTVNQVAQENDLSGQIGIVNKTVEVGMQTAGMQGAQSIEGSFGHIENAPTGLPGHESGGARAEAGSPSSSGEAGSDTVKGEGADTVGPGRADTVKGAGADTKTLPPEQQPEISKGETADLPKGAHDGETSVTKVSEGDPAAQRAAAAQNVAQRRGLDDVNQLGAQIRREQMQAEIERSLRDGDTGYGSPLPGETIEQAAGRLAEIQEIPHTSRPDVVEANILGSQNQLEKVVTGRGAEVGISNPTPDTVATLYDQYAQQVLTLRQAHAQYGDRYFQLTDPQTAATLREALNSPTPRQYWLDRYNNQK